MYQYEIREISKSAFDSIQDENERRKRLTELDRDIEAELKEVIANKMQDIVDNLNRHGHSLKRNISLEDIDETDFCERHNDRTCGFRVDSTVTISSGYNGASDCDYQAKE
ncbi:hypothetical protein [Microbulbifer variabilis]|uniref:hypothetical protein n=1 Tax=Microbulbifer variabilis TaxID=266805 RepID=UPI000373A9B4|nr:hypothetical protein [Microbulbifer variabilis]